MSVRNEFRLFATAGLLFAALSLFVAPLPAQAGIIEPAFENHLATLPESELVSVIILLAEQTPIADLDAQLREAQAPLPVRHQQIITALQRTASLSRGPLLAELDARKITGDVRGYTAYWIGNLVVAQMKVKAVRELAARPDVALVESNFTAALIEPVASEPGAGAPAAAGSATPGLRAINAPRVWSELGITGAGRLVAGLDTGVMGTHVALQSRWRGRRTSMPGVPWYHAWKDVLGTNTQSPNDSHGHGTHTMGTMVGLGASTQDTVGVAFGAQWIACNAINQGVGMEFDNDVITAFQWIADPDGNPETSYDVPDVVQNSWRINERFPGSPPYTDCDTRWWMVMDACEAAGCAVVFSAGNEGPGAMTIGSPPDRISSPTNAYAIGAVDATNFGFPYPIASFSSRGPSGCDLLTIKPEVVAPGVRVRSTTRDGGYQELGWNGTSMAGPHVSGICALMRQANPNIDVTTMKEIIMCTARDLGDAGEDNTYGWGIPDAYEAVLGAMSVAPPPLEVITDLTVNMGTSNAALFWTAPGDPQPPCDPPRSVAAYDVRYSFNPIDEGNFATATPVVPAPVPGPPGAGECVEFTVPSPQCATTFYFAVKSVDLDGDVSPISNVAGGMTDCGQSIAHCPVPDLPYPGPGGEEQKNRMSLQPGQQAQEPPGAASLVLRQRSPNPANEGMQLEFLVPEGAEGARYELTIYDLAGRRIRTLAEGVATREGVAASWSLRDESGRPVPGGVYFARLHLGSRVITTKIAVLH